MHGLDAMPGPQVESEGAVRALQDFQQNVARQFMIRMVHPADKERHKMKLGGD